MSGPNITTETIVDGLDLFDDDDEFRDRVTVEDPISAMVGAHAYVESYVDDECYEAFGDGTWTEPKTFDRYYYERQLLIDIIEGTGPDHDAEIERDKATAFKREWAKENDRRYVVLNSREFEENPDAYFAAHLAPLGIDPPGPRVEESDEPVPMILGPEPPLQPAPPAVAEAPAEAVVPPEAVGEQPAAEIPDAEVEALDAAAARGNQNPLAGVDLEAEGFEETITPLAIEDADGVTRVPEPEEAPPAPVAAPKAEAAPKAKPKPKTRSKVQRPRAGG